MRAPKDPLDLSEVREKTPYVSPVLIEYGDIVMITRTGAGPPIDNGDFGIDDPTGTT